MIMDKNELRIREQSLGLLSMLAIQFILGMILNLFVTLPKTHPGQTGNYFMRSLYGLEWAMTNGGGLVLLLHIIVAIALLLASFTLVFRTIRAKSTYWTVVSVIGALGVIVALTNGLAFLGYNSDAASFTMAMGFIVAAVAYGYGLAWESLHLPQRQIEKTPKQHASHNRPIHVH